MAQPLKKKEVKTSADKFAALRAFKEKNNLTKSAEKEPSWLILPESFQKATRLTGIPLGYCSRVRGKSNTGKSTLKLEVIKAAQRQGILPVVFNAGMEATGDVKAAVDMTIRVLKSEAIPMILGFIVCDLFVTIGWIGMVLKGMLPVKKWMLICCPVFGVLFGNLLNLIAEGLDSGTESFGWLTLYLVCALTLTEREKKKQ